MEQPQNPTTEFELQNQYGRVIHPAIRNFIQRKKYTLSRVKKYKISPQSPKTEFGLQNSIVE
jgi:hypothetical protein